MQGMFPTKEFICTISVNEFKWRNY